MPDSPDQSLAIALFGEILAGEQLIDGLLRRALPSGMTVSHFATLNHLANVGAERSPAQLAKSFHLSRGAVTNTIARLEAAGHVRVRSDPDDARSKRVSVTEAGQRARDAALLAVIPLVTEATSALGEDRVRAALPVLRDLRLRLAGAQ